MTQNTVEILKLVAAFLTPILVFTLGFLLIKKIESIKSSVSKEKSWQEYWASQFVEISKKYNDTSDKILHGIYIIGQTENEKLPGWEEEIEDLNKELSKNTKDLMGLEWKIQTAIQFAPNNGNNVRIKQERFYRLIGQFLERKQGDLEEIRVAQFEFNEAVRVAHSELLQIPPDKIIH